MKLMIRLLGILILFSLSGPLAAQARAPRCESVFLPTVLEVIQQLDAKNNDFILQGHSIEDIGKDFSWLRRRKLRKLINDTDLQTFVSDKAVERYAIELGTVLFGKKEAVDRWIRQDKETRLEDSTVMLIKEKLLQDGLIRTWGEINDPRDAGIFRRSLDKIWAIQHSRILEWMRIPMVLPGVKNQEVPPDLMFKIIRDGFKEHAEEARIALKSQSKIEAYNTFRRVYSATFLGIVLVFNAHTGYHKLQDYHKQQVTEVVTQLQETRKNVESAIPKIKQEQFEEAYRGAEADFIKKWGEPPTEAESQIIKARIAEALNIK
ncbi:hypothetical protein [Bdellovibrio sp. BCCA]|uniref:hypothetical protein n=1 Tax=Bdellovibrio sp. BCCA TaxID=3136281 RepID=UPI0030F12E2A